jgi:hypothetical protein
MGLQAQKLQEELKAGEKVKTEKASQRTNIADLATSIEKDPRLPSAVGPVQGRLPSVRGPIKDFDNQVKRLKASLSVENREKMKGSGAISDFEAKQLGEAATALDQAVDEPSFRRELQRINQILGGGSGTRKYKATVE